MALVDLQSIYKSYEAQKILVNINFVIEEGERVALVGKNGSGKSTLAKIIAGTVEIDEGKRILQNNVHCEMLSQDPQFLPQHTVRDAIEYELKEFRIAKSRYDTILTLLSQEPENKKYLEECAMLASFLDFHHAWNLDDKIERVLKEFDLKQFEYTSVVTLSGGEKRRVGLAALLLKKPDILILDEPTNHLDVYMVAFLEELLLNEKFTLLFISHDRYFIDRLATRTVEVEEGNVVSYRGGYADYIRQKEELLRHAIGQHEVLLKLLKNEEEWLRRGVKARLKRNEGRKERVLQMRDEAKKNPSVIRKMQLQIEREKKHWDGGNQVNKRKMLFELHNIGMTLGSKILMKNFSTRFLQADKVAIVGRNGSGKSTLLKLLLGDFLPTQGKINLGEISIGYFDQNRTSLDDSKNILETFCPHGGDRVEVQGKTMHVYGYLKYFLFPPEYLDKKIGILSGGEKNRIALALLLTKKYDLLILDEPTNDLDIPTINILEEYLINFTGAIIFVSHDRYFVDKLAERLYIFKGDGTIEENWQTYSEYLEDEAEIVSLQEYEKEIQKIKVLQTEKKSTKLSFKEQRELDELPEKIEKLEGQITRLETCLSNPECYQVHGIHKVTEELEENQNELEPLIERYFYLLEKVDSLSK